MGKHKVIIIGSGFGGQCAAIKLTKQGIDDWIILERRPFAGGTWQQNTYPGAAVDVQSPLYSIASEPYAWSQMFAEGEELSEYTDYVARKHRIHERTVVDCEVTAITWDDDQWRISTSQGDFEAQFVINASGPLSTPVIPDFPGRRDFAGEQFHTNDWNHDFDYRGMRVAVVGSGASAAQVIPKIQPDVAELHVFQRTPHWVMPRPDRKFSPLQQKVLSNRFVHRAVRTAIYWSLEMRIVGFKYSQRALEFVAERPARKLLEQQVQDEELREKLTPDFTIGCKRIILSNTFLPAMAAENCTVHDKHDGIERVTEDGIVTTQGENVDVDLIVWSTGYDATDGVISYPVTGRGGKTIGDFWADYPRAYLGTTIPDFPNLFIVTGPNTGIGHTSAIFIIESQMEYISRAIDRALASPGGIIEVTAAAEEAYTADIHKEMERTVWHNGGCNSWYKSRSGKVIAMYPGFSFTFRRKARDFREQDHRLPLPAPKRETAPTAAA
ncbi:MAG: NAD(P)/FAD-dependent oxidoreductase [Thermoleophilaceae bacterium]|nr:NAD(P)/FAD-dependent oxidoreductase [Thermoleophilaceae bacterium]